MCSNPSALSLVFGFHFSLILGTDGWQTDRVSDWTFLTWVISGSSPIITMQNERNHLSN